MPDVSWTQSVLDEDTNIGLEGVRVIRRQALQESAGQRNRVVELEYQARSTRSRVISTEGLSLVLQNQPKQIVGRSVYQGSSEDALTKAHPAWCTTRLALPWLELATL